MSKLHDFVVVVLLLRLIQIRSTGSITLEMMKMMKLYLSVCVFS